MLIKQLSSRAVSMTRITTQFSKPTNGDEDTSPRVSKFFLSLFLFLKFANKYSHVDYK